MFVAKAVNFFRIRSIDGADGNAWNGARRSRMRVADVATSDKSNVDRHAMCALRGVFLQQRCFVSSVRIYHAGKLLQGAHGWFFSDTQSRLHNFRQGMVFSFCSPMRSLAMVHVSRGFRRPRAGAIRVVADGRICGRGVCSRFVQDLTHAALVIFS